MGVNNFFYFIHKDTGECAKLNGYIPYNSIIFNEWAKCSVNGCDNKVCFALDSDKCFIHTKGKRYWKLFKIWFNNFKVARQYGRMNKKAAKVFIKNRRRGRLTIDWID